MSNNKPLTCPSCGAALELTDPSATVIRCKYCNTEVPVPQELQAQEPQTNVFQSGAPVNIGRIVIAISVLVGVCIVGSVLVSVVPALIGVFAMTGAVQSMPGLVSTAVAAATDQSPAGGPLLADPADVVLQFGSKGNLNGQFDDPTAIAVDGDGNIYVCDRMDGRLQKFDATGKFLWLQTLEGRRAGSISLALDSTGHLYAASYGNILQFDVVSGKLLNTFEHGDQAYYVQVAAGQDNVLYAFSLGADDDIVRLDTSGKVLGRWKRVLTSEDDNIASPEPPLTVDGLGNVYVAVGNTDQVFAFNKTGKYLNRWGDAGTSPGQLQGLFGIAVDGQQHLYIADAMGVEIFTTGGHFLARIAWDRAFGQYHNVTLDSHGDIYVVGDEGKVVRFHLKAPLSSGQ